MFREQHRGSIIIALHNRGEHLQTLSAGLLTSDPDGCILAANRALLHGLPISPGRRFGDLFRARFGSLLEEGRRHERQTLQDEVGQSLRPQCSPHVTLRTLSLIVPGSCPMFKTKNDLEALMQAAATDPRSIPAFYKTLLETEIYILTPETPMVPGQRRSVKYREKLNIVTVDHQGLRWHPASTSKDRIAAYVKEPEVCLGAVARNLFEMLPGSNIWLNPLGECQKPMPASEVSLLMSGEISGIVEATE